MTAEILQQHLELRQHLQKSMTILDALRHASGPHPQNLSGLPRAPGFPDPPGDLAIEIVDVLSDIQNTQTQIQSQEPDIIAFINAIPDTRQRTICRMRFLKAMSWREISLTFHRHYTKSAVRMACKRCLLRYCDPE